MEKENKNDINQNLNEVNINNDNKNDNEITFPIITKKEYENNINEIKNNIKKLQDNIVNIKKYSPTLQENVSKFITNLNNKIEEENNLIGKYNNEQVLSMKFYLNINKFKELILLNNILHEFINKEFKSYENMLTQKGLLEIKHPIANFIKKHPYIILDSKIYDKIKDKMDIGKFLDKIENKEIKEYIIKNKIPLKTIYIDNNAGEMKDLLNQNLNNVKTLIMNNLNENDFLNLFNNNKSENLFDNIILKKCKLNEMRFSLLFPNIHNLYCEKLQFSPFGFDKFSNIKILSLINCNLIDFTFSQILQSIMPIKDTLQILCFSNNRITLFNVNQIFSNLEELDLSYNKISRFEVNSIINFPKLKILDLTSNNFASLTNEWTALSKHLSKGKICLFFQNIFVMRTDFKILYYNYFNDNLLLLNYPIKKINFECFFDKNNYELLKQINFNLFQNSITSINLNCCEIDDDKIFELLENNFCLFNLRELLLKTNNLSNKFFTEFNRKKLYNLFPHLKKINLSNNNIKFEKIEEFNDIKDFLLKTQSLKKLYLKNLPIENNMTEYLKKELKFFYDSKKSKKAKLSLTFPEEEIKKLILFLKDNSNVVIYLRTTLKKEYSSKLKKHFNWIYNNFFFDDK